MVVVLRAGSPLQCRPPLLHKVVGRLVLLPHLHLGHACKRPTVGSVQIHKQPAAARLAAARLTHDAFLRRRRDDVAHVQVLGGQFAVQAQEVAETPLDGEIFAFEQGEGGLEVQGRGRGTSVGEGGENV